MATTNKFYTQEYSDLYENKVVPACECIEANRCSVLSSKISSISEAISGMTIKSDAWNDDLGRGFQTAMEKTKAAIDEIKNSIDSKFTNAETKYETLKTKLEDLAKGEEEYQKLESDKPLQSQFKKTSETTDSVTGLKSTVSVDDVDAFNKAMDAWNQKIKANATKCTGLINQITTLKGGLTSLTCEISVGAGSNIGYLTTLDIPSTFKLNANLPIDSQMAEILRLYGGELPSRVSQGGSAPWKEYSYAGGPLRSTGCGLVSFSYAVSRALGKEYGEDVYIQPNEFGDRLYSVNGTKSTSYGSGSSDWLPRESDKNRGVNVSRIAVDTTNAFKDISVLQFKYDGGGVFNESQIKETTGAGGTLVTSLLGAQHVVCVKNYDSSTGKYNVMDPGNYQNTSVGYKTEFKRYDGEAGTIAGKRAWDVISNNSITVSGDNIVIKGVDARNLPEIEGIAIAGKAYNVSVNNDGSLHVEGLSKDLAGTKTYAV